MGTTANGLDYPELSDPANVPGYIQGLAVDVDARYGLTVATVAALSGIASPFAGMQVWVTATAAIYTYNGSAWFLSTPALSATTVVTSNQGPTSGTTELVVASAPATTFDGTTPVEVMFTWQNINTSASGDTYQVRLYDGPTAGSGTQVANFIFPGVVNAGSSTVLGAGTIRTIITPTAGSHTYTARLVRTAGANTATLSAGATGPAVLSVRQVN